MILQPSLVTRVAVKKKENVLLNFVNTVLGGGRSAATSGGEEEGINTSSRASISRKTDDASRDTSLSSISPGGGAGLTHPPIHYQRDSGPYLFADSASAGGGGGGLDYRGGRGRRRGDDRGPSDQSKSRFLSPPAVERGRGSIFSSSPPGETIATAGGGGGLGADEGFLKPPGLLLPSSGGGGGGAGGLRSPRFIMGLGGGKGGGEQEFDLRRRVDGAVRQWNPGIYFRMDSQLFHTLEKPDMRLLAHSSAEIVILLSLQKLASFFGECLNLLDGATTKELQMSSSIQVRTYTR